MLFRDRVKAGRKLARKIEETISIDKNSIILGLPRGGVIVAAEVAKVLRLPLDVLIVRKLGFPGHEEMAMGAISEGGQPIFNIDVIGYLDQKNIDAEVTRQGLEVKRRVKAYRDHALNLADKTVIIVDDGIATGMTAEAALLAVRELRAKRVIVATPVASQEALTRLKELADQVIVLDVPAIFYAVGQFYEDFPQVSDEEVKVALALDDR